MADDLLEETEEETEEGKDILDGEQTADAGSAKKFRIRRLFGNKKRLIIMAACLLVLLLAAGGAWFFFSGSQEETPSSPDKTVMTDEEVKAALEKEPEIVFEDIVVLEPFERIELKSSSAMKFISLGLCLELTDQRYRKMVVTVEDRIRKIIQGQLREMTWIELRNPEGKIKLKYELLKRINSIFPKVTVRNLYFTNFLMQ